MNLTFSTSSADTHACLLTKPLPYIQKTTYTRQNCSTQQYLCLRLLKQVTKVKLIVEVASIPDESSRNHL